MDIDQDLELQRCEQNWEMPFEGYETVCWGCGLRLRLPSVVPTFKCGWCGAISSHNVHTKKPGCCTRCSYALDRVLVATVFILMLLIIGGGTWAVFPILFPRSNFSYMIHLFLTCILTFNTLFNYCVAAIVQAGPLPQIAWGQVEFVTKGALEGHRFCHSCKKPKPPTAHHCRACKACVLEMDHHCPFIGNCVGAANHRSFILFLLFAVVSNFYVLLMSGAALLRVWSTLLDVPEAIVVPSSSWHVTVVLASFLRAMLGSSLFSSLRTLMLLYLVAISLSVIIGVGLLLHQQLQHLRNGYAFIDSLQFESALIRGFSTGRGWRNLRRVFGHGHPIFWPFPKLVSISNGEKVA